MSTRPDPEAPLAGQLDPFAGDGAASSFHIADYFQVLKQRWRLIAVATLLSLTAFAVRYTITPREYRAETQIQIERRSLSSLTSSQGAANPWLDSWWNMEYYPTQYRLLQSRGLAERVVRNLRLAEDPEFNPGGAAVATGRAATAADDEAMLGALANRVLGGLQVTPIANTQLVVIAYTSQSPRLASSVANGFADAFIEWGLETRSQTVGKASSFIEAQITQIKQEIASKEAKLQELARNTGLLDTSPDSKLSSDRFTTLNQSYLQAKNERIGREARYRALASGSDDALVEGASPEVVAQRNELNSLKQDYEAKLKTFKPEWPKMQELKARIDAQEAALVKSVREATRTARDAAYADYQAALRNEQGLERELSLARDASLDQSSASLEYTNLATEISTRRDYLNDLLRTQNETGVTSRLQETRESNVKVVDRALLPGGPFRPSLRRELSLGLMLGLVLGIGIVFLIEFLDRSIKDPAELERIVGLPTLAVIPDNQEGGRGYGYGGYGYGYGARSAEGSKKKGRWLEKKTAEDVNIELLPHSKPRLAIAEAYRQLRTAMLLSSAEELRVISVTSAESGEGKTTTAVNLAVVMAQLGRRVLMLDGDLRKPRLHEIFQLSNRFGVVNLLTGAGKSDEVFQRTTVPNLFVIPSGPIPPNPAELLASDRMADFVQHVRSHFDFVLIDSPPALAVTDATLIGTLTDGVLFCVAAGKVPREEARACRDRLVRAEVKILGAVLNRYRADLGRYGKRYQRYEAYTSESTAEPATGSAA